MFGIDAGAYLDGFIASNIALCYGLPLMRNPLVFLLISNSLVKKRGEDINICSHPQHTKVVKHLMCV